MSGWLWDYSLICQPVDYTDDAKAIRVSILISRFLSWTISDITYCTLLLIYYVHFCASFRYYIVLCTSRNIKRLLTNCMQFEQYLPIVKPHPLINCENIRNNSLEKSFFLSML